jgi:hypothetical protein
LRDAGTRGQTFQPPFRLQRHQHGEVLQRAGLVRQMAPAVFGLALGGGFAQSEPRLLRRNNRTATASSNEPEAHSARRHPDRSNRRRPRLGFVLGGLRSQAPERVGGQLHGIGPLDTAAVVANADGLKRRIVGAQRLEHHETVDDLAHVDGVTPLVQVTIRVQRSGATHETLKVLI